MENEEFYKMLSEITSEYRLNLINEFEMRWKSIPLDLSKTGEFEVIWGLVSRQCSFVYQMSYSFLNWNELFLPIIMRCMIENHINISWLLMNPEERAKLFVDYGLSNESKYLEYIKSKQDKSEIDLQFIQNTENWINEQRFIYINKINIGSWNFSNVRKTAEAASLKDYYDLMYPPSSSATHSTWNYIAKNTLKECENPLHKYHRLPIIKDPEIEIEMFLILTKIMQDTFEKLDTALNLKTDLKSSFSYIISAFQNKNSSDPIEDI